MYDTLNTPVVRTLHSRANTVEQATPDTIAYSDLTIGWEPLDDENKRSHSPRPFVQYFYFQDQDSASITKIYNPAPLGARDEWMCSANIRPDAPTQLVLAPCPRGGNFEAPEYATIDDALAGLRQGLDTALAIPEVFTHMEHMSGLSRYTVLRQHERLSEAKDQANGLIRMTLQLAYPDNPGKQQRAYILAKGLSAMEQYADTLLLELLNEHDDQHQALGQHLTYEQQLILASRIILERLNYFDDSLPQPYLFCEANEVGVAYAVRASREVLYDYENGEQEAIELMPKRFVPYNTIFAPEDATDYAYRFEPSDNGLTIIRLLPEDHGYRVVYRLWLGASDSNAATTVACDPRAGYARIPRELTAVRFISDDRDVATTSLASPHTA